MSRYKRIICDTLRSQSQPTEETESQIAVAASRWRTTSSSLGLPGMRGFLDQHSDQPQQLLVLESMTALGALVHGCRCCPCGRDSIGSLPLPDRPV